MLFFAILNHNMSTQSQTDPKVVLISGGSDGLGKVIAEQLSATHKVVILARTQHLLEKTAAEIGCQWVQADVSKPTEVAEAVAEVLGWHQRIDVLINCAGRLLDGALDQCEPYEIEQVTQVNVLGVMYLTRAVLPRMKQLGKGRIITIGSQAGFFGRKYRSVYNASKWAVRGFSFSLQQEVAKHGIGVSVINPGLMQTDLLKKAGVTDSAVATGLRPESVSQIVKFVVESPANLTLPELGVETLQDVHCW